MGRVAFYWQVPHIPAHSALLVMAEVSKSALVSPPHVYFDDSGCNAASEPDFIWAGYWGSCLFWQKFGNAWNKILDRPPALPYWHQTRARAKRREPPFDALDDRQIARRERSLAKLIFDNHLRMAPLAVRVANADIAAHVTGQIRCARPLSREEYAIARPDLMEREHFITLMHAMARVVHLQDKGDAAYTLPVSLHCENREGDPFQDHVQRMWKVLAARDRERMGTLDFPPGKSRQAPQLQAADMLAWHLNREAKGWPRDPMWALVAGERIFDSRVGADSLEEHVRIWNAFDPPRLELRPGEKPRWIPHEDRR